MEAQDAPAPRAENPDPGVAVPGYAAHTPPTPPPAPPIIRHSGLGVASFVLSLVAGIIFTAGVAIAGYLEMTTPGGLDETSGECVIVGFVILFSALLSLIALGLGIAGLIESNRRKVFAVLGTVFSLAGLLALVGLLVLGALLET